MIPSNGRNTNVTTMQPPDDLIPPAAQPGSAGEPATRAKLRAKQQFQQNRFVIIGAGALVLALLVFVAMSMPRRNATQKPKDSVSGAKDRAATDRTTSSDKSLFPITDSGRPAAKEGHQGFVDEQDLERSATRRPTPTARIPQSTAPGTLGSIPPFGGEQWQAPPYQSGALANNNAAVPDLGKAEREAMEKSSLVYVRNVSAGAAASLGSAPSDATQPELGLGLAIGTRLRARLESAASTAVRAPVLAVIEYNYERGGEIVVPAGAKAIGHLMEADRSGYVRVQFDSLMMPDGATVPIQAVATELDLRPPKGKVEGKNTGKNVLVRSLSGIGEAGALLLGRGSLNQPLSESDLVRERLSNNVGEAGDEEVSRLSVTQQIVVTIPANREIYVVLEQAPKPNATSQQPGVRGTQPNMNAEQLRQLLELQRELNSSTNGTR
jgi:hypothetical protein